jgi:hypothetical protein
MKSQKINIYLYLGFIHIKVNDLMVCIKGLSGRTLRKLPFLAYSQSPNKNTGPIEVSVFMNKLQQLVKEKKR